MSVKVMGRVYDADLPRDEKTVLLAYADHASHDGRNIYPSIGLIAWKTGYDRRSVQRITRKLETRGVLVLEGARPGGTNVYSLIFSELPDRPPYNPSEEGRQDAAPEGRQGAAGGAAKSTPGGGTTPPEPSGTDNEPKTCTPIPCAGNSEAVSTEEAIEAGRKELEKYLGPHDYQEELPEAGHNYAVPVAAGGEDPATDAVLEIICQFSIGAAPTAIPEEKREAMRRRLHEVILQWSAEAGYPTEAQARLAAQVWVERYDWKRQANIYTDNFADAFGLILTGVLAGTITAQTAVSERAKRAGGSRPNSQSPYGDLSKMRRASEH